MTVKSDGVIRSFTRLTQFVWVLENNIRHNHHILMCNAWESPVNILSVPTKQPRLHFILLLFLPLLFPTDHRLPSVWISASVVPLDCRLTLVPLSWTIVDHSAAQANAYAAFFSQVSSHYELLRCSDRDQYTQLCNYAQLFRLFAAQGHTWGLKSSVKCSSLSSNYTPSLMCVPGEWSTFSACARAPIYAS